MEKIILPVLILLPFSGAVVSYLTGRKSKPARDRFAQFVTILEFLLLACTAAAVRSTSLTCSLPSILGGLQLEADGFRALYAGIAGLMWAATTVFSEEYLGHYRNRNRYYFFVLLTFGATVGVFLSADLFTAFIFFEIMSFTSYVMVIHDETPTALRAGETYLAVAILGGMVMLMGLFLLQTMLGTLTIRDLGAAASSLPESARPRLYLAGALVFFGYAAKAGVYPLHIWLPKAHPAAPAPASALLSGILTKAGIFGILVLSCHLFLHDASWGKAVLILGVITMFLGALLAVFSINLKRTLACSSVSQIGFILVGFGMQGLLGEENALAVWGSELHMVNHSLFKLILFLCAGTVYMNTHRLDLNEIRGFGRRKPLLMCIYLSGALGIGGIPLFSGYISKTLLHESIVEYSGLVLQSGNSAAGIRCVEWIFLLSGGLTVAYMTKLFVALFLEKNTDPAVQEKFDSLNGRYMNLKSALSLGIPALLIPIFGVFPSSTMQKLAEIGQSFLNGSAPAHAVVWFSPENLKGAAISVVIGAAVYFGLIRTLLMKSGEYRARNYVNLWPPKLDLEDSVYRPLLKGIVFLCFFISNVASSIPDWFTGALNKTLLRPVSIQPDSPASHEKDELSVHVPLPDFVLNLLNDFSYGLALFGLGLVIMIAVLLLH